MAAISLQDAQARLAEVVRQLPPGAEVTITDAGHPVARLVALPAGRRAPRPRPPVTGVPRAGQYEGRLVVPDDFDDPLDELREYTG
jgi:prevent-host-death family protein